MQAAFVPPDEPFAVCRVKAYTAQMPSESREHTNPYAVDPTMDLYGPLWTPMSPVKPLWQTPWTPMDPDGPLWTPMDPYAYGPL